MLKSLIFFMRSDGLGVGISITPNYLDSNLLTELNPISIDEPVEFTVSEKMRVGYADVELHWQISKRFNGGPDYSLATVTLAGGIAFSCLLALVFSMLLGTNTRIRERVKIATRELRQSKQLFQDFLDNSPAVAFIKDKSGRYLLVSRSFETALNVRKEDVLGKVDASINSTNRLLEQLSRSDKELFDKETSLVVEESVVTADGQHRSFLTHKFLFGTKKTRFTRWVGCPVILPPKNNKS